jgi:hypothetical protein
MDARSRIFSRGLATLSITILTISGALADDSGSVSGTVVLRTSRVPVSGVLVRVLDNLGINRTESSTDKDGRFYVVGLQPGHDSGLFEKVGLEQVLTGFDICPGAQTTMITLMNTELRTLSGSPGRFRLWRIQPNPSILSTSSMTVIFNQWSGESPPRCI